MTFFSENFVNWKCPNRLLWKEPTNTVNPAACIWSGIPTVAEPMQTVAKTPCTAATVIAMVHLPCAIFQLMIWKSAPGCDWKRAASQALWRRSSRAICTSWKDGACTTGPPWSKKNPLLRYSLFKLPQNTNSRQLLIAGYWGYWWIYQNKLNPISRRREWLIKSLIIRVLK